MIKIPEFKFKIGDKIKDNHGISLVYDISYSMLTKKWYYRTSYWEHGYEHHCKCDVEYVETNFEAVK